MENAEAILCTHLWYATQQIGNRKHANAVSMGRYDYLSYST